LTAAQSYLEQAQYVQWALDALGTHPLASAVKSELQLLVPVRPSLVGLNQIEPASFGNTLKCGSNIVFNIDPDTGAIVNLVMNGVQVATSTNRVADLSYSTYDGDDFNWYEEEYAYYQGESSAFVKPDIRFGVEN
jgi:hypothetical protein